MSDTCKGCKSLRKYKDGGWFCSDSVKAYESGATTSGKTFGLFKIVKLNDVKNCSNKS